MDAPAPRLARMSTVTSPRQMAGMAPPTTNPASVMTGTPSLRKVLDMGFGGSAEINDPPARERDEVSRAGRGGVRRAPRLKGGIDCELAERALRSSDTMPVRTRP